MDELFSILLLFVFNVKYTHGSFYDFHKLIYHILCPNIELHVPLKRYPESRPHSRTFVHKLKSHTAFFFSFSHLASSFFVSFKHCISVRLVIVVMKEVTQLLTTNIEPHEDGLKSKYNCTYVFSKIYTSNTEENLIDT